MRRDRWESLSTLELRAPQSEPPASNCFLFAHCRPGSLDFRFHGVEVEARALLHRRELDRSHGQLLYVLLDKHEAPEFVLEPREVILRPGLSPITGPARALEWIEAKIGQVGHVGFGFITQPAT